MSSVVTSTGACFDDDTVAAFVGGELGARERSVVEAHLGSCDDCALLVAEYAFFFQTGAPEPTASAPSGSAAASSLPAAEPSLPVGALVSRFVLGRPLGRGGAGEVFEAYDPQLKRKVALKLLRPLSLPGLDEAAAQARLLQEAEAMARVSHPNVVAVHDAGIFEGRVYIVMELVEGQTLASWLRAGRRTAAQIIDVFTGAGRGLEAAHANGLVHRDFKPQNVLVGDDGRARVTDFGLARLANPPLVEIRSGDHRRPATIAGGTPLFMAPEQHRGEPATAASDQFAFGLAFYRSLFVRDPFGLETRRAWASGESPRSADPPRGTEPIPVHVRAAVMRALAVRPPDRWPSMTALLAAVAPAARVPALSAKGRRTGARIAAGVAALAVVALVAERLISRPVCGDGVRAGDEQCDDGNALDKDSCLRSCRFAMCGDGHVRAGVEECDGASPTCYACQRCTGGSAAYFWPESGHCYTRHDERVTWEEATAACHARGGDLVSFGGAAELIAVAPRLTDAGDPDSWIGLRRMDPSHGFAWSSGDPLVEPLPRWWKEDAKPPGQNCAYQSHAPARSVLQVKTRWPTAACDERRGFICEAGRWMVAGPNNHAYRVYEHRLPWPEAREACRKQGAYLTAIGDAAEHKLVAQMSARDLWIGASTIRRRGPFVWANSQPFRFGHFAPGEPDAPQVPACVLIGADEVWHDRGCIDPEAYVCERE